MCRNIKLLYNLDPPTDSDEIRDAALQFVRKISGMRRPSKANVEAFERAVEEVTAASTRLLDALETRAPPRDRAALARKARERFQRREGADRV